ncbi:polysaccharide biosynthesis protein [Leptolyngbya sp. AN02str]|uniref:polysaccharide biosynthesis protein n=1 Tax=Leptolyngbya sp. AN02str TaxID=3423363 RepID=UPI003D3240AD
MATDGSCRVERKSALIAEMQQLVPPGSPEPTDPAILDKLKDLTQRLIRAYQADGGLQGDPFDDAWTRNIHLYETEVQTRLTGKRVLVTGGEGYVGRHLIERIATLGAVRVASVDKARCGEVDSALTPVESMQGEVAIAHYAADLRDERSLSDIFDQEKPDIVFHLAAQRLPGLAEIQIKETVTSNVFGTRNIIRLCEQHDVEACIFSSTGKASRYCTGEVYAASKKLSEWQFAYAAQHGKVTYAMVRFTHMLNNSSFCEQYDTKIGLSRPVNVHAPNRYIVGQNIGEAIHLLLNALIFAEQDRLKFVLCRNLGWPTETLEVALHKIMQSGKDLCIYFQGVLPGYEEPLFRGQVDWTNPSELNTLINAAEVLNKVYDPKGQMIMSYLTPFCFDTLFEQLAAVAAAVNDPNLPEQGIKQAVGDAVTAIATTSFQHVPPETLLKILKWGTDPKYLQEEKIPPAVLENMVRAMMTGLNQQLNNALESCVEIAARNFAAANLKKPA